MTACERGHAVLRLPVAHSKLDPKLARASLKKLYNMTQQKMQHYRNSTATEMWRGFYRRGGCGRCDGWGVEDLMGNL